jgi:hypothetical protein
MSETQEWPDGTPVTPWADPWHDVAGDVRDVMRQMKEQAMDPPPPPCTPHGLLVCPWCPS